MTVCMVAVYIAEDLPDESDAQYVPEPQSTPTLQPGGDLLARSLQQLQEGLDSGTVMTQFEVTCHGLCVANCADFSLGDIFCR